MTYIALWWKVAGYTPLVTRTAVLSVSAFALLGLFRLAQRVANTQVALASVALTALYSPFFVQSSLAHVDLAAAAFAFWGLRAYVGGPNHMMLVWFSLATLAKETAIIVVVGLLSWELLRFLWRKKLVFTTPQLPLPDWTRMAWLLGTLIPLLLWYLYHYQRTGFVFGNAEFFRYNVQATVHPLRILLALLIRIWQTVGYLHLWVLTVAAGLAMWKPALTDEGHERPRIAWDVQLAFLIVTAVYVLAMAVIGGAVLARYMFPVVPLVILVCASTLWRRVKLWKPLIGIIGVGFVSALFVNPPYGFSFEDNLAYRDYIVMHQHAAAFLEARHPMSTVLTAWPANDELARPDLGYITRPMKVIRIEDFTAGELMSAAQFEPNYDFALVFSTKYEPPRPLMRRWKRWDEMKMRYFNYHRDLPPEAAAGILGGNIVFSESRQGQWVAVIELEKIQEASLTPAMR